MGKCWMFEATGEVRRPERGEWFWYPRARAPEQKFYTVQNFSPAPIMKLTEYPSNPLEPIREVGEKWRNTKTENLEAGEFYRRSTEFKEAIQKCMAIVEGK